MRAPVLRGIPTLFWYHLRAATCTLTSGLAGGREGNSHENGALAPQVELRSHDFRGLHP